MSFHYFSRGERGEGERVVMACSDEFWDREGLRCAAAVAAAAATPFHTQLSSPPFPSTTSILHLAQTILISSLHTTNSNQVGAFCQPPPPLHNSLSSPRSLPSSTPSSEPISLPPANAKEKRRSGMELWCGRSNVGTELMRHLISSPFGFVLAQKNIVHKKTYRK